MYRQKEICNTEWARKDFAFPDNLISLLYLDIWKCELLTKKAERAQEEYYGRANDDTLSVFQFQPCSTNFEVIDDKTFVEVLYPKTIYDLIDFSVRERVKREVRMRVCKNCGRYFTFTGRSSAEDCNRVCDDKGRTCREMAPA